ncbi:MAG: 16S rRNA (cytidine(1402)-2'-O)-methyltransferase [Patescibacteria group bacterium]
MPKLYLIATPIGHLKDLTFRALDVLKEVDFIICEDKRETVKLLNHYEIKKPLISYHEHSKIQRVDEIINLLRQGKSAGLVSEAGTPGISDPGNRLIADVLASLGEGVKIIPIPGPSALAAAASVSGLPCDRFVFLGFLPHKKGRETLFKQIAESRETVIFYESPHRVLKTLQSLSQILTEKRKIVVCRELTKMFEEIKRGNINEIKSYFENNLDKVRGEFVVLVGGKK